VGNEGEPFARILGNKIGAFWRTLHEKNGVKFVRGARVVGFKREYAEAQVIGSPLSNIGCSCPWLKSRRLDHII
jgi:hypothetical protein